MMEQKALTEKQAAIYLGMSRSYLRQDRMNGVRENKTPGPRYLRIGNRIRYLKKDLDSWLESHLVEHQGVGHD